MGAKRERGASTTLGNEPEVVELSVLAEKRSPKEHRHLPALHLISSIVCVWGAEGQAA